MAYLLGWAPRRLRADRRAGTDQNPASIQRETNQNRIMQVFGVVRDRPGRRWTGFPEAVRERWC